MNISRLVFGLSKQNGRQRSMKRPRVTVHQRASKRLHQTPVLPRMLLVSLRRRVMFSPSPAKVFGTQSWVMIVMS